MVFCSNIGSLICLRFVCDGNLPAIELSPEGEGFRESALWSRVGRGTAVEQATGGLCGELSLII